MPSDRREVQIAFPMAGLNRRYAQQRQPPYSTCDASNVRPDSTWKGRERGGSRPGVGKAFYDLLGSGANVRMLAQVSYLKNDGFAFWEDYFKDALGNIWTTASWIGTAPTVLPENLASATYNTTVGVVRGALSPFDTTQVYRVEVFIVPYADSHQGKYQIFLRMNDTTPVVTTDGIQVELVLNGALGTYSGTVKQYSSSALTSTNLTSGSTSPAVAKGAWFTCELTGTTLKVYWDGNQIYSAVVAAPAGGGKRFGFGMNCTNSGGFCLIDTFRVQYYKDTSSPSRRDVLVASANGTLYKENWYGSLTAVSSNLTLNTDRNIQAVEHLQKLYIADYGDNKASGTDGVKGTTTSKFDSASYSDWTAVSPAISTYDDMLVITAVSPGSDIIPGAYQISTVAAGELTLDRACCTTGSGTCTFYIARGPKVYDPNANTLTMMVTTNAATYGSVPVGCPCIARYRDRIFLAGHAQAPHMWYESRQTAPLDWLDTLNAGDAQRPTSGATGTSGSLGLPITTVAPHRDDYMILGCDRAIYVLRGDPTYGGSIDTLSDRVGVVDKQSWCRGPDGEWICLTRQGIYSIGASAEATPASLSHERLPRELLDYSPSLNTVLLAYDVRARGVHIYLTQNETKATTHWWFDWETKGFWPVALPQNYEPTALLEYQSQSAEDSCVLLGCRDGYVRRYRNSYEHDDGTSITSYVIMGPFQPFGYMNEAIMQRLVATLGDASGPATWGVLVGETCEDAATATALDYATGTWNEDRNYDVNPRARGNAIYLKVSNQASRRAWYLEAIQAVFLAAGRMRKG